MTQLRVGSLSLKYQIAGEAGSPVLLIMGLGVAGSAWAHQVPALSARHRVVWFDNRGVGGSDAPPGPYSMPQMAADAAGLLDALGLERAHVAGVSMGGMVAQELALAHPERVLSLALIATHAGGWQARLPTLLGAARFIQAHRVRGRERLEVVSRLLFPAEFLAGCDRQWLWGTLTNDFGTPPAAAVRDAQLSAVLKHDTRARLNRLGAIPTLIVRPGRDLLVRPRESDRLHRAVPGSRLLRLDEAGHGVIRQCADTLNASLLDHFALAEADVERPWRVRLTAAASRG